jgi:pyridoxal phosphate enzyme (YggS family)
LTDRLGELHARIDRAARAAGRARDEIRLVAVSKTFPASSVLAAADAGLSTFGENRVQEAAQKIPEVAQSGQRDLRWHLVGRLQRNKARKAVGLFDVIESVDRLELAAELERAAAAVGKEQEILIQVNIDEEPQKGGVLPAQLTELLTAIDALPHLRPLGLMTVPQACEDPEQVRPSFARMRSLLQQLNQGRPSTRQLSELSMGMSADFEIAIQEGASWIRVGSAIFGERGKR